MLELRILKREKLPPLSFVQEMAQRQTAVTGIQGQCYTAETGWNHGE